MDALRQIRFLIPPFFVLGAIGLAAYTDPGTCKYVRDLLVGYPNILIAIAVAGVLPVGFIISTVTILLLKFWYGLLFKTIWQADLTDTEYGMINALLGVAYSPDENSNTQRAWSPSEKLNLIVNFDHGLMTQEFPGVANWSARTYSAFMVSANSIVALWIGGAVVSGAEDLNANCLWGKLMLLLTVILFLGAWIAKRDCTKLTKFVIKNFGAMKPEIEKKSAPQGS